jgi:hypothetical protein
VSKRPTTIDQLEEIAAFKLRMATSAASCIVASLQRSSLDIDSALYQATVAAQLLSERRGVLDAITILKQAERREAAK